MTAARALAAALVCLLAAEPAAALGLSDEQELGARFALVARRRLPLLREPAVTSYVQRLGQRLVARLDRQPFAYRFFVVREPSINAFAVPGGYVYVHVGLLNRAKTEAELGGVLAHEVVHVDQHHVVRQQEKTTLVNYGTLLGLFLSAVHPALGASAVSAGAAVQLKYQREFEQEADHAGFDLMQRAGFDAAGMPSFLRTIQREQQLNPTQMPPYFLSHPLTDDRVAALEKRLGEVTRIAPAPGAAVELGAVQAVVQAVTGGRATVLEHYRGRLEAAPEDPQAQYELGLVYLYSGLPEQAATLLGQAAAALPRARADHGRALGRLGDDAGARAAFSAHLGAYPDDHAVRLELAKLDLAAGDLDTAERGLERALAGNPELDEAEYALAEVRGKRGDPRGQWWHLGRAFTLRGDFARALNAYEKARELSADGTAAREEVEATIELLAEIERAG